MIFKLTYYYFQINIFCSQELWQEYPDRGALIREKHWQKLHLGSLGIQEESLQMGKQEILEAIVNVNV